MVAPSAEHPRQSKLQYTPFICESQSRCKLVLCCSLDTHRIPYRYNSALVYCMHQVLSTVCTGLNGRNATAVATNVEPYRRTTGNPLRYSAHIISLCQFILRILGREVSTRFVKLITCVSHHYCLYVERYQYAVIAKKKSSGTPLMGYSSHCMAGSSLV